MSQITVREHVLEAAYPYTRSVALMVFRKVDHVARTVTFYFSDDSTLVFEIRYEVRP